MQFIDSAWTAYFGYIQNDRLAAGAMAIMIHESVFFLSCFFWLVVERVPFFNKWRIQPNKTYSGQEKAKAVFNCLLTHLTTEVPFVWFLLPIVQHFAIPYTSPLPHPLTLLYQVIIFMIIDDSYQYWVHRLLHHPRLYPYIHKRHHTYKAPFALAAEYASPIETSIYGLSATAIPLLYHSVTGQLHLASIMCYFVARMLQTFDSHCGYDFPWGLRRLLPGVWAGARHHDDHHRLTVGNYAGMFCWWDWLCGTGTEEVVEKRRREGSRGKMVKFAD
ncbi:hypothetical protein BJ508DRAFT_416924 [Ascobolus immersus RN42]|uniref:Fatty acid hydroxylase domain-containing protein n=1 Tax=Ascobolus immersus RN42 TaxID=1160509 RepID=A0A3N4HVA9_ASCIM|nr:hypothetical protein BJ508DRAFT_416924 [Ascobolus immersus RN42]